MIVFLIGGGIIAFFRLLFGPPIKLAQSETYKVMTPAGVIKVRTPYTTLDVLFWVAVIFFVCYFGWQIHMHPEILK